MVFILPQRLFHCSTLMRGAAATVNKSLLAQLRKSTGYSISHCKKALVDNDNDFDKASSWLAAQAQAEGWAKASKLAGRSAKQGLLGITVSSDNSKAALLEINCETDFVARNSLFVELISEVTESILATKSTVQCTDSENSFIHKELFSSEQLSALSLSGDKSLGDRVALTIGLCGENMVASRAIKVSSGSGVRLYGYTHPGPESGLVAGGKGPTILRGKFAALVAVRPRHEDQAPDFSLLKQLCVQVIGMNPEKIGTAEELQKFDAEQEAIKIELEAAKNSETAVEGANNSPVSEASDGDKKPKDKFLMLQNWLDDEESSVAEVLEDAGLEVVDFVRLQVGGD